VRMRVWRAAAAAVGVVMATACAASSTVADPAGPPATTPTAAADPARLVGSWHLTAPGEPSSAVLTIGDKVDGGILLFRPCGMLSGGWAANRHGMFVASLDGGDSHCFPQQGQAGSPLPKWLDTVVGFAARGRNETLVDATGDVVATLRPGAHPSVGPDDSPDYVAPPVITDQMRKGWAEPAAMPGGTRPATRADLLHRWVRTGHPTSSAFVRFDGDGSYSGSDGCNGQGGRYVLGPGGIVLATSGPSTLIGCENSPLPAWVGQAGRLGLRQGRLVFVDRQGKVLGTATREA
jgi:hypothetical protein